MTGPNPAGNTHHNFEVPVFREVEELIKCLSDFPHVGIAVVDCRFRYLRLNPALAAMNGVPADCHVGKTLRDVLGPAAQQLEPRLERVFATGKSTRFEFEARLPKRNEPGRWNVMYFPVGKSNQFEEVCAVVRELTENSPVRMSLYGLTSKLKTVRGILNRENLDYPESQDQDASTRIAIDLLNGCIREVVAVSKLSRPSIQQITQEILTHESAIKSVALDNHESLQGRLTKREVEIVRYLAEGKCNKEIAAVLRVSVKTVETYRTRIMPKLGAHSLSDVTRFAVRHGLITITPDPHAVGNFLTQSNDK